MVVKVVKAICIKPISSSEKVDSRTVKYQYTRQFAQKKSTKLDFKKHWAACQFKYVTQHFFTIFKFTIVVKKVLRQQNLPLHEK